MQLSNAPAQIVEAWATGDSSKTNPIPIPSQIGITPGAASWTDGFPPLCDTPLASGGIPPAKADMNGGLFQMSAIDMWMCAGAGFSYNSGFASAIGGYPKGARVLMAIGNGYWISTVDNNMTDPDTGGAGWIASTLNGWSSGSNANGAWVKDPTGTITQRGVIPYPSLGTGDQAITFPIPFTTTTNLAIVCTSLYVPDAAYIIVIEGTVTTTGFSVHQAQSNNQGMSWIAIGN
jgi:hypothetical protein